MMSSLSLACQLFRVPEAVSGLLPACSGGSVAVTAMAEGGSDIKTADLCDEHGATARVLTPIFSDYGGTVAFSGPVATVRVFEDNTSVREVVAERGDGRVLLVDGAGSMRCALLGDQLATMALRNGWSGLVVYGCVRDSAELAGIQLGIKALGTHPRRSGDLNTGESEVPVTLGGTTVQPGEWLGADLDGIVIAVTPPA